MRSIAWIASAATLGAALTGLVALGGSNVAVAQGMMQMGDNPPPKATKAAAKRGATKPVLRKKRAFRSAPAVKTCGQFKYWSKGKCLDARTTPPKL
jgi:hypothetical protein